MSEPISQALNLGQQVIWELVASFQFKGGLYLNRFRVIGSFFIPMSPA